MKEEMKVQYFDAHDLSHVGKPVCMNNRWENHIDKAYKWAKDA